MNKKVVWIGSGGTNAAFAFTSSIDRNWNDKIELIVSDIHDHNLVATSLFAGKYYKAPLARDAAFLDFLIPLLNSHGVDSYVPTHDHEIVAIAENWDVLTGGAKASFAVPGPAAIALCHDKLSIGRLLSSAGIKTPTTQTVSDREWPGSSRFGKPRFGCGSIGASLITNEKEWAVAQSGVEEMIAQEICFGPEITIDIFRDERSKFIRTVCRERIATKAGVCVKARLFSDPVLHKIACGVAETVGLTGSCCIQVMKSSNGNWVVTDVNARMGAGTQISLAGGLDFAAAHLAYHWGEDFERFLPELAREKFVVRYYSQIAFDA